MYSSIKVDEASKLYGMPTDRIIKLVKDGYVGGFDLSKTGDEYIVTDEGCKRLAFLAERPDLYEKLQYINPTYYLENHPELIDYYYYHDFLDRFVWLIKLYHSDKQTVKKKNYRLDILLQEYILHSHFTVEKLRKKFSGVYNYDKVKFHLLKGWYNELVRSVPFDEKELLIGTKVKGQIDNSNSVSWNIIQSYYAVYEYFNVLTYGSGIDVDSTIHRKPAKVFNNCIASQFKNSIFSYPFNLNSHTKTGSFSYFKHLKYEYARYPRVFSKNIWDLESEVVDIYKKISVNVSSPTSLIDFLYDFRVWANYTGIETLIKLENGYLLDFLFHNLGTIVFFMGGISELTAISVMGEEKYFEILDMFTKDYISKHGQYQENVYLNPIYIRHRIYHHLGLIGDRKYFYPSAEDPIVFMEL